MEFVVDANVLFALCNKKSATSLFVVESNPQLYAPSFAFGELAKYKKELLEKSNLGDLNSAFTQLKALVSFVNEIKYTAEIEKAMKLIKDPKDVAYLALALFQDMPIWSNDAHFKEQSLVQVFTTKELLFLM